MSVSREWIGQVREVMGEIGATRQAPRPPGLETEAWRAYQWHEAHAAHPPLEQTPRARGIRQINRIALRYGWGQEVARHLDMAGAGALSDLQDYEVEELRAHMEQLVDRAMTACDLDDDLPAR